MEKIIERNILYDFYGELLTEHQRKIYEDAVYGDLSLSELSDDYGISRQGIHDLLKRCDKILLSYEDKLHLIDKFRKLSSIADEICVVSSSCDTPIKRHLSELTDQMKELL